MIKPFNESHAIIYIKMKVKIELIFLKDYQ